MRLDALAELDSAHYLNATGYSQNAIDLTNPPVAIDLGNGEPLEVIVTVDVAADATDGDETYEFDFIQSANPNLNGEDKLVQEVVARATLVAGYAVHVPIPKGAITKRYIGMKYTLGGTTPSITVSAHLMPVSMTEEQKAYASGFSVS